MPTADDDVAQLQMLARAVAAAFSSKDADAAIAAYASGASLFVFDVVGPPGMYLAAETYREALRAFFASFSGPLNFSISDLKLEASGDIGYGYSLQHVSGVRAKDGKPVDYTVRVTNVYRKLHGKWLIVQEHVSLPLDRSNFTPILDMSFGAG